jgi:hypothetical protein
VDIRIPTLPAPNGQSITRASTVIWGDVNGVVQDKFIEITNGVLIMDVPLIFLNCEFMMAGDVVIQTEDNHPFTAISTKFFSCNNMWKGIEAKGNSLVSLWFCEFEDARVTLQIDDVVPEVYLVGNIFNRNHLNITNGSFQPGGDGTINLAFCAGNTFECTSKTVHGNGPNNSGAQWTLYHVLLDHCSAAFIGGANIRNRFFDCNQSDAAIYLKDADLVIQHADFKRFGLVEGGDQFGYAIYTAYSSDNILFTGSHILARNCTFESEGAQGAILAVRSDLEVRDCKLDGSFLLGLHSVVNTASEQIRIINNDFNLLTAPYVAGVWAERPIASLGKHLKINNNRINQVDAEDRSIFGSDGIQVESSFNISVTDEAEISGNTIFFDIPTPNGNASGLVNSGIFINTSDAFDNTKVNGNTVTAAKAFMGNGILYNDQLGAGGEISHNTINGNAFVPTNVPGFASTSILVNNATLGVKMCDNTVNGSQTGIQMSGNNGQTDFSSNSFGVHNTGLKILPASTNGGVVLPGSIGDQARHGNTWLDTPGAYSNKAGICDGNELDSEFFIENQFQPGSIFFPSSTNLTPNIGWFSNQGTTSDWCQPGAVQTPGQTHEYLS